MKNFRRLWFCPCNNRKEQNSLVPNRGPTKTDEQSHFCIWENPKHTDDRNCAIKRCKERQINFIEGTTQVSDYASISH